ncbi:MAG: hypothetical protein P8X82_05945 [Gemmatimonadales bacterium]
MLILIGCSQGAPFGTVQLGDLIVDGEVDPDFLYMQLGQLDPRFEACYVRALREDRTAEGVIEIHIRGSNTSLEAEVTANQTQSESLADCVAAAVSGLTIIQRDSTTPWDFVGDWSVQFQIVSKK